MKRLITLARSVIPACDVSNETQLMNVVTATSELQGIGAYKVGLELSIVYGLRQIVQMIRRVTDLPVIYDHQKAGNDIPELGSRFAASCRAAGVEAVILFPFGGARTERDWIAACQDNDLHVIVGGHMTHEQFLVSEGGFISDEAPRQIYEIAARCGVRDFVVPGNKTQQVQTYRMMLEGLCGGEITLYAPGFIAQGGQISDCGKVAGKSWHAIVGSAIYKAADIKSAATKLTQAIQKNVGVQE